MKWVHTLLTAFVCVFVWTTPATAIELEQIADVNISAGTVTALDNGSYLVRFEVTNNAITKLRDARYGVRLQESNGPVVYVEKNTDNTIMIEPHNSTEVEVELTPPVELGGEYDIVATVQSKSGATIANALVQHMTLTGTDEGVHMQCAFASEKPERYSCTFTPTNAHLVYRITKGGVLGSIVEEGPAVTTDDGLGFVDLGLLQGRYGVTMALVDTSGVLLTQKSSVFSPSTGWIAVSGFTQGVLTDGVFTVDLFLEGTGEIDHRGFVYGVIAADSTLCASGEIDLTYVVPRKRTISVPVDSTCIDPMFSGFLYDGFLENRQFNVIDSFGALSPKDLVARGVGVTALQRDTVVSFAQKHVVWMVLAGLVALVVGITLVRSTGLLRMVVMVTVLGGGLMGHASPVHAATFTTTDNPNSATFTVNLDKSGVFSASEDVTFTFNIEHNGAKPIGATALVNIDGGSNTMIVGAQDTSITYGVTLSAIPGGGTHTLNFTVPDLCGSALGYSTFDNAVFGTSDCTFSVDFKVYENTVPAVPQMRGSCTVGATNTYEFSSVDDGKVYYQVRFDNAPSTMRTPSSGYIDPYPTYAGIAYGGWTTQGNKTIRARAIDTYNARSPWKIFAVMCTPVCAPSIQCDGSGPQAILSSVPALTTYGRTTTLEWDLSNVQNCSIQGTNGDTFGWSDVISTATSTATGAITQTTTYTMNCTDFDGGDVTASTTVRLAPVWNEF